VLQDGVLYDPNKGQGHKGLKKVTKMAIFSVSRLPTCVQSKD